MDRDQDLLGCVLLFMFVTVGNREKRVLLATLHNVPYSERHDARKGFLSDNVSLCPNVHAVWKCEEFFG